MYKFMSCTISLRLVSLLSGERLPCFAPFRLDCLVVAQKHWISRNT